MKKLFFGFAAIVLISLTSHAEQAGVITVFGSLKPATDAICPMRPFQYYVSGDYRTSKGAIANFGACLGSVSIPLFEVLKDRTLPSATDASAAINRTMDAETVLAKNIGRTLKMRFFVSDTDGLKGGLGTLLSIEETK